MFGVFKDLIPSEALEVEGELQRGQGWQGLLPDFRLELPSPIGQPQFQLAELKIIGAVETRYPRSSRCARKKRGVERRRDLLAGEYRNPLAAPDSFKAWSFQEASKDLHDLLHTMADDKVTAKGLARGREGTNQERSIILAGMRRELSMTAAKVVVGFCIILIF